mmetsp:Transcript_13720/g.52259  ORF Transcript_13720/g.52259 Transcript_13720/m.52259 type:complete len:212 (-) Transcript_13720:33-668(-)
MAGGASESLASAAKSKSALPSAEAVGNLPSALCATSTGVPAWSMSLVSPATFSWKRPTHRCKAAATSKSEEPAASSACSHCHSTSSSEFSCMAAQNSWLGGNGMPPSCSGTCRKSSGSSKGVPLQLERNLATFSARATASAVRWSRAALCSAAPPILLSEAALAAASEGVGSAASASISPLAEPSAGASILQRGPRTEHAPCEAPRGTDGP